MRIPNKLAASTTRLVKVALVNPRVVKIRRLGHLKRQPAEPSNSRLRDARTSGSPRGRRCVRGGGRTRRGARAQTNRARKFSIVNQSGALADFSPLAAAANLEFLARASRQIPARALGCLPSSECVVAIFFFFFLFKVLIATPRTVESEG